MYLRALGGLVAGMLLVSLAVAYERWSRLSSAVDGLDGLFGRDNMVPNYHHVWFVHDMAFANGMGQPICIFGNHLLQVRLAWSLLCHMDSDEDGFTNGEELGDPCCRWEPTRQTSFSLSKQREYRRWGLTHPGGPRSNLSSDFPDLRYTPAQCSDYDAVAYAEQFHSFYFRNADGEYQPTDLVMAKVISLGVLLVLLCHWFCRRDLCADLVPCLCAQPHVSGRTSLAVMLLSYVYMDMTSGIVHLILDYAPHSLPVLGGLARGFQFHHHDPTAIIRISWYAYVSHVHLLCPVVAVLLILSDASRVQRLFWFWGAVFVHLFQTAHRWAHRPPESLPWPVLLGQRSGLLLTHERHMSHHQDLERQFTILMGHTDVLLDAVARRVPPIRYDIWLFIAIVWFLLPVALDVKFRRAFQALELTKGKQAPGREEGIAMRDLDL